MFTIVKENKKNKKKITEFFVYEKLPKRKFLLEVQFTRVDKFEISSHFAYFHTFSL